ncbi:MAG: carboxypeptidase M32 [Promethearchaeota archaeon]
MGTVIMESFAKLQEIVRNIYQLATSVAILRWDLQTYLPPRGFIQRADQLAYLRTVSHRMMTSKDTIQLIDYLEKNNHSLNLEQRRELHLIRRELNQVLKVPEDLVAAESTQRTVATRSWRKAKQTNNWSLFESDLITLLDISKRIGEYMMEGTGAGSPYDALMDIYEPGMTSDVLKTVFSGLRKQLVPLVGEYSELCKDIRMDFTNRNIPITLQKNLVIKVAQYLGYDTISESAGGRIDSAEHPFTTGYFEDVRMTVNYKEGDIFQTLFAALHEIGHSLHKQNQNPKWKWMFLGDSCSSGINESQSRFIENLIGRSKEFWEGYYPQFQRQTENLFNDVSLHEFVQAVNIVKPSRIRVTADEMTYALHIIIRFEIEQGLFNDRISVKEIPSVWNEKYDHYLGVRVNNDSEGALQDTHWAWGMWGYFPTYCLGNLYSAMIQEQLAKDMPNWRSYLITGDLSRSIGWLRENIHRFSNRYDPAELIKRLTGRTLTYEPFIKYLKEKYSNLYS